MSGRGTNVATGILWSALRAWGTSVFSMLAFLILARLLQPAEVGLVNYVLGWIAVLLVLADLGLAEYLVYHRDAGAEHEHAIWWFQVGLSVLLAAACTGAALLGWFEGDQPGATAVVVALAWTLPVGAARKVPEALMRRDMRFREIAMRSMLAVLLGGVSGIAAALAGLGVWSLVIKQWVENVVDLAVFVLGRYWRPGWPRRFGLSLVALKASWGIIGSRLLDVVSQRLDILLIGSVLGMANLGYYSVGQRMYQVLQEGLAGAVTNVMSSRFAALRDDLPKLKAVFLQAVGTTGFVIGPVMLLGALFAADLVQLALGAKWAASAQVLALLCLGGVVGAMTHSSLGGFLTLALRRQAQFMVIMGVNFASTFGLLLGLARFGLTGVASVPAIRVLIVAPFSLGFAWRALGCTFREHARAMIPAWGVIAAMAAVALVGQWFFPVPSWWRLGGLGAVTVVVGVLVAFLAFRAQFDLVLQSLSRRKSKRP